MPGRLYLIHTPEQVAARFRVEPPPIAAPRRNVAPGQPVPVLTPQGWRQMRWGLIPVGRKNARGRPVMETIVNARSETVFDKSAFLGLRRCVVPASGWYEWTGKSRHKIAWDLSLLSGAPLGIAAVWDTWSAPGGVTLDQVATLTCEPNAEVGAIHHRMGVFLDPTDIPVWLEGSQKEAAALMRPIGDGLLRIAPAEGVDWSAA